MIFLQGLSDRAPAPSPPKLLLLPAGPMLMGRPWLLRGRSTGDELVPSPGQRRWARW